MAKYKTEITSDSIPSDNPIHQRLLKAYYAAKDYVQGDLLEIGCGDGRGIELLSPLTKRYVALDKIQEAIATLSKKYPKVEFVQAVIPPIRHIEDDTFDTVVSFQVIEHIENDKLYLEEIYRVLKPGGKAIITTPNIKQTLSRNPWHIREYTADGLEKLAKTIFTKVEMKGIAGNEKVMEYHENNRKSVNKIMRFDVLNLQYHLPAALLKIPYEFLNRRNRNKLKTADNSLVMDINHTDYSLADKSDENLDLFCILEK